MNLALFDFDGTITSSDSFAPFVRLACSGGRLVAGTVALAPLIAGYRLGVVPATTLRKQMARFAFHGKRAHAVDALGARYAASLGRVVRPEALSRMRWHQRNGDAIVVVSASLASYLKPWSESVGAQLICSELEANDGVLTGRYRHGDCTGAEKARRVQARFRLADYSRIYAYGDTQEDTELLSLAHEPYPNGIPPSLPA